MSQDAIRWLHEQLPDLVEQEVLTAEAADRLRRYYGAPPPAPVALPPARAEGAAEGDELLPPVEVDPAAVPEEAPRANALLIFFAILGGLLIGGGIILLLAHNWNALSRPARTAVALAPLVAAQGLAAWVLIRRRSSLASREGVGSFWFLAVGAAIALISQTYHIHGELDGFLLTWFLLAAPVVYLLRAAMPAILALGVLALWLTSDGLSLGRVAAFWPLSLVVVPFFLGLHRQGRGLRYALLGWALAPLWFAGLVATQSEVEQVFWPALFAGLFCGLLLLDRLVLSNEWMPEVSFGKRPFDLLGTLGVIGLSLVFTFEEVWKRLADKALLVDLHLPRWGEVAIYSLDALLILGPLGLWIAALVRRRTVSALLGAHLPLTLGCLAASFLWGQVVLSQWLFNGYTFALGLLLLVLGVRRDRLGMANAGMLTIAACALLRFFDSDLPFTLRGVVFIALGIGFLAANLVLVRRRRRRPA